MIAEASNWLQLHVSHVCDVISGSPAANTGAMVALEWLNTKSFFILLQWGAVGTFIKMLRNPFDKPCLSAK